MEIYHLMSYGIKWVDFLTISPPPSPVVQHLPRPVPLRLRPPDALSGRAADYPHVRSSPHLPIHPPTHPRTHGHQQPKTKTDLPTHHNKQRELLLRDHKLPYGHPLTPRRRFHAQHQGNRRYDPPTHQSSRPPTHLPTYPTQGRLLRPEAVASVLSRANLFYGIALRQTYYAIPLFAWLLSPWCLVGVS